MNIKVVAFTASEKSINMSMSSVSEEMGSRVLGISNTPANTHLKLPYTMSSIEITKVDTLEESTTDRALKDNLRMNSSAANRNYRLPCVISESF